MSNADVFIEKYKELESIARRTYNISNGESISRVLIGKFPAKGGKMRCCAEIRNICSHEQRIAGRYPIEPDEELILFLEDMINRVKNRPRCANIATLRNDMYTRTLNDSVRDTMTVMREKNYTHVPILENERVIGIFDENSLFEFIADDKEGIFELGPETIFADIKEHLRIDNREMEIFQFHKYNDYADVVKDIFNTAADEGKRLGMIFFTQNGRQDEALIAIVTPWDVLGI